jgi:N-acetylneuraminate synthase
MSKIEKFFFDKKEKPYIIAEVAQNHDGSLGQAHAFIDAIAATNADAIKFQTHIAEEESTPDEPFRVKFSYADKTRYDYWKRMEFTESEWQMLFNHAKEKGLDFLSSPFSLKAVEMLNRIGIPAWKIGSGEVFNDLLMDKVMESKKPIILSTGMSTFEDIDAQVFKLQQHGNPFILMQCTTSYPTSAEQIGINMITELKKRYNVCVGLSDHSSVIYPALAAVTLGASAIEVHVTMSQYMFGPDVSSSITIEELKKLTEGVQYIHTMNQNPMGKSNLDSERIHLREIFSKSLYIGKDLNKGDILTRDCITVKKPGTGIMPSDYMKILGSRLNKSKTKDSILSWEDIEHE